MSYSNRELVEFYIGYRLSKRNHPTSLLRKDGESSPAAAAASAATANGMLVKVASEGSASAGAGDVEAVKRALQESADEFEQLFTQAFSDISSQLEITSDTAYDSFKRVMDEVFKDGVNWGRVVGLFAFGGVLCVECAEKDLGELVPQIADWMTKYLDEHISPWIQSHGGWDCFAEIFGNGGAAGARRTREALSRWLLAGVVLITGVLVGVFIAKKQ